MPTIPKNVTLTASSPEIMNMIRANSSVQYQDRIPIATQENFREVGNFILNYEPARNEFLNALVNRIARVIITSKSYQNPLRMFKKGLMGYGDSVEEIFAHVAKAHQYNPARAETDFAKREIPDVSAVFHRMNYQNFYKKTIEYNELKLAFLSENGVQTLIAGIVDAMYTGSEVDEFIIMKNMIAEAATKGQLRPITVPAGRTREDLLQVAATIKATSNMMEFMSPNYNYLAGVTRTRKQDQYLIISAEYDAIFDVEVLAAAFNMDKAEFVGHKVLVDDFGRLQGTGIVAALVDKDWFMVFDNDQQFTEFYNGEGLYWNYWYHVWKTFSTSPFVNAVVFTTNTPTFTGITVTPTDPTVKRGSSVQFNAQVTGTGGPGQAVIWSVNGGTTSYINNTGLLSVPQNEESNTLSVTATAQGDRSVSKTVTVTIS